MVDATLTSAEIIVPALKTRREGYGEPTRDYKRELCEAVAAYGD